LSRLAVRPQWETSRSQRDDSGEKGSWRGKKTLPQGSRLHVRRAVLERQEFLGIHPGGLLVPGGPGEPLRKAGGTKVFTVPKPGRPQKGGPVYGSGPKVSIRGSEVLRTASPHGTALSGFPSGRGKRPKVAARDP